MPQIKYTQDNSNAPSVDIDAILSLLPTQWQKNIPVIAQVGGLVIGGLGAGFQWIATNYPDSVNKLAGAPGYLSLAGGAVILCGTVMHRNLNRQIANAAKVSMASPPARSDGTMDAIHTFAVGIQQGTSSGNLEEIKLAATVMQAILDHKGGDA